VAVDPAAPVGVVDRPSLALPVMSGTATAMGNEVARITAGQHVEMGGEHVAAAFRVVSRRCAGEDRDELVPSGRPRARLWTLTAQDAGVLR
jgi:hypothetical protein